MNFKLWLESEAGLRDFILRANKGFCDSNPSSRGINCRLFVQLMTKDPEIDNYPEVEKDDLSVGDVLVYGRQDRDEFIWGHYAIFLGGDEVLEVPKWNEPPRINKIKRRDDDKRYDTLSRLGIPQSGPVPRGSPAKIVRPNWDTSELS